MNKERVLFLCTHNSARSQMAEGLLRAMAGGRFEVQSAGIEKTPVHPLAIRAMTERGIDITAHTSKVCTAAMRRSGDDLITVCDGANERCRAVPGFQHGLHWSFEDPSRASGTDDQRLAALRRIRDQIEARLSDWLRTQ